MKLNTFNLVITIIFAALSTANACEKTVMGGCVVVETHDTSSHMKSQIVNQVITLLPRKRLTQLKPITTLNKQKVLVV